MKERISVVSYNIRYDTSEDGEHQWRQRRDRVVDLIRSIEPDIFGLQEVLAHQQDYIANALPSYTCIGVGRSDGVSEGEHTPLYFRKDRFSLKDYGYFWLSESPAVPGSRDWGTFHPRVVTWGEVVSLERAQHFFVFNAHFEICNLRGEPLELEARLRSVEVLKKQIIELAGGHPVIVMGDMNFSPEDEPYRALTDYVPVALKDTWSHPLRKPTYVGFNLRDAAVEAKPIDYILTTPQWESDGGRVIEVNDGYSYPSDHLPVAVNLSLPAVD